MCRPSRVSEAAPAQALAATGAEGGDPGLTLAAWQARGVHRFDPVRFRYIEALARRSAAQSDGVRPLLEAKLATLLAAYGVRYEQASVEASQALDRAVAHCPAGADRLRQCHARGDFNALHRLAAELVAAAGPAAPLAELVRHIERQSSAPADQRLADRSEASVGAPGAAGGPAVELKAVRMFRSSWARLRVDQQLTRSFARIPEQAGPLNSQLLVLRSLQLMRDVAPAYLSRFMSYVDALLWLDQAGAAGTPARAGSPGTPARAGVASASASGADKKRKPARGRSRDGSR